MIPWSIWMFGNPHRAPSSAQGILVSELDCLQYLVNSIPLQSFAIVASGMGRLVTTTFTGPLWAYSRFTSALLWLLRLAQRELEETNKLHREGIQYLGSRMTPLVGSASRCTARAFLQGAWNCGYLPKHFFHCINRISQPQFSCDRHKKAANLFVWTSKKW